MVVVKQGLFVGIEGRHDCSIWDVQLVYENSTLGLAMVWEYTSHCPRDTKLVGVGQTGNIEVLGIRLFSGTAVLHHMHGRRHYGILDCWVARRHPQVP